VVRVDGALHVLEAAAAVEHGLVGELVEHLRNAFVAVEPVPNDDDGPPPT
jgi:hypothetical protein